MCENGDEGGELADVRAAACCAASAQCVMHGYDRAHCSARAALVGVFKSRECVRRIVCRRSGAWRVADTRPLSGLQRVLRIVRTLWIP
jgi:hypothetical protein